MKKVMYGALALALLANAAHASFESNRTFVKTRDSLSNNYAMGFSGRAHQYHNKRKSLGANISVAPYYRTMHNKSEVGTAFGSGQAESENQKALLEIAQGSTSDHKNHALQMYGADIDAVAIGDASQAMYGNILLNPEYTEFGAHFSYRQRLDFIAKGLYLTVDAPVARIITTLGAEFEGRANSNTADGMLGTQISDYFGGKTFIKSNESNQQPLRHAIIDNTDHIKDGFTDFNVGVGYQFFREKGTLLTGAITMTIPAGKTNDTSALFVPRQGGGHIGLGARLQAMGNLLRGKRCSYGLNAYASVDYRYLFEAEEQRTLGIYNHWYNTLISGGAYRMLVPGITGPEAIPAANHLSRTVQVTPGHTLDALVGLRYHYEKFSASLCYNLYARDTEEVKLAPSNRWFDGQFAMQASGGAVTDIVVGNDDYTFGGAIAQEGNTAAITLDSNGDDVGANNAAQHYISTLACTSHSDLSHKICASLGWNLRILGKPCTASIGAEYEFNRPTKNYGIRTMGVWGKLSLGF